VCNRKHNFESQTLFWIVCNFIHFKTVKIYNKIFKSHFRNR